MRSVSFRIGAVILASGLALSACGDNKADTATATATESWSSSKTFKICSDIPYEPMEYGDGSESTPSGYTGFDIDLVQKIADDAKLKLSVSVTPFDGIFGALNAKKCDAIVSSVSINDERKKNYGLTEGYYDSGQSLLVRKADADTYKTLPDLAGKNIGVQTGTTGEDYTKANLPKGATITSLADAPALFAALESKKIDAVLQDLPVNLFRATKNDQVAVSEKIDTKEKYAMATRKGDAATLKLLTDGIAKARSDGNYDAIFEKYFGKKP